MPGIQSTVESIALIGSESLNCILAWLILLLNGTLAKLYVPCHYLCSRLVLLPDRTAVPSSASITSPVVLVSVPRPHAFDQLPHDIITQILLSTKYMPSDMVAISAVSRRMRHVALSLGSFWATMDVRNPADLAKTPFLLDRSGSALLDVTLHPKPRTDWKHISRSLAALLQPQLSRIHILSINLASTLAISSFVDGSMTFDELVDFSYNCLDRSSVIVLRAPRLRSLLLSCALVPALHELSASNITFLSITSTIEQFGSARIDDIFRCCGFLVTLKLAVSGLTKDSDASSIKLTYSQPLSLERLALSVPFSHAMAILNLIPPGSLRDLDIIDKSNFRAAPHDLHPIVRHLIAGGAYLETSAPLWETGGGPWGGYIRFHVQTSEESEYRTYALRLAHPAWEAHAINIWQQIWAHRDRHLKSQSCIVDPDSAHWFARTFALCPPSDAPLHASFDPAIVRDYLSGECYWPPILVPPLKFVTLDPGSYDVEFLEGVVCFLADDYLLSDQPQVYICICSILLPSDCSMPRALARLQFALDNLRRRRARRGRSPEWFICSHWVQSDTWSVPVQPETLT